MGTTNWKQLYTNASIMLDKYQNEVVPQLREQLEKRAEVVRCKDCKHYQLRKPYPSYNATVKSCCRSANIRVNEDDFCSYGERREGE
jgi:hypothetical protein